MPENIQKILRELKAGLRRIYGEQLHSVILFGSYARGDAHPPDSDIDVMIVLKGEFSRWEAEKLSSEFVANLCLENDGTVHVEQKTPLQFLVVFFFRMPLYMAWFDRKNV